MSHGEGLGAKIGSNRAFPHRQIQEGVGGAKVTSLSLQKILLEINTR